MKIWEGIKRGSLYLSINTSLNKLLMMIPENENHWRLQFERKSRCDEFKISDDSEAKRTTPRDTQCQGKGRAVAISAFLA